MTWPALLLIISLIVSSGVLAIATVAYHRPIRTADPTWRNDR